MTLVQFLSILRARWMAMLAVLVVAIVGTAIVNALLPSSYTSTAAVLIDVKSPDPIAGIIYPGMTSPSYMATQVDVVQSDRVSQYVVRSLRLGDSPAMRQQWREATRGEGNFEIWLANLLRRSLEVRPSRESNVITINYKSVDPKFATTLANAYARAYIEATLELRVEPAKQYGRFFDERSKQLREKVELARGRISTFQREKGIVGADERLDVETARLNELSSQMTSLQALRSESASREAQARSAGDRLPDAINSGLIAGLRAELSRQESKLSELTSRLDDNHPSVIEQRAGVGELRSRVDQETRRISGGVSISNNINESRVAQVRAAVEAQRAKVLQLKESRDQLAVLNNDLEASQKALDQVVARANLTELESRTTQTNVHILNPASEPGQPSSPRVTLNMLLALFVGTLLGVGVALLMELFDRRVRSPADVVQLLDLSLLGVLAARPRGRLLGRRTAPRALGWRAGSPAGRAAAPARDRAASAAAALPQRSGTIPVHEAQTADATAHTVANDAAVVQPRVLGDILRETRDLGDAEIDRILVHQRENGLLFGEAAIAIGVIDERDVMWALSQQFRYPYSNVGRKALDAELVVSADPFSSRAESFRGIRSQLIRRLGASPRRVIAVVSPDDGDGKSFVAANLAIAFSQLGRRTLLVDGDMRSPRLDRLFQLERGPGLSAILSGRVSPRSLTALPDLPSLYVLPVGATPPNPLELLESPTFDAMLAELSMKFDYIVIDTPSARHGADAGVISARGGAYLTVARRGRTRMNAMQELVTSLRDPQVVPLGFIVNEH